MYTVTIIYLILMSYVIIYYNPKMFTTKKFLFWLVASCMVGWIEFVMFLRFDAWVFDPKHITGLKLLGVTIEDYLFCPAFSIIFYALYHKLKFKFKQRVFNPTDKMIFALVVSGIMVAYYDMGSLFAKYMFFRAALGWIGLIYCWNYSSFRHCITFLFVVYLIGFGWDLPSVNMKIWTYPLSSTVYDGLHLKIFKGIFPVELFSYYFTGGFFSFWMISFFDKYFSSTKTLTKGQ